MTDDEKLKVRVQIVDIFQTKNIKPNATLEILMETIGILIAAMEHESHEYRILNLAIKGISDVRDQCHAEIKEISKKSSNPLKKGNEMENPSKSNKRSE